MIRKIGCRFSEEIMLMKVVLSLIRTTNAGSGRPA
jgi:hypothetical protein